MTSFLVGDENNTVDLIFQLFKLILNRKSYLEQKCLSSTLVNKQIKDIWNHPFLFLLLIASARKEWACLAAGTTSKDAPRYRICELIHEQIGLGSCKVAINFASNLLCSVRSVRSLKLRST